MVSPWQNPWDRSLSTQSPFGSGHTGPCGWGHTFLAAEQPQAVWGKELGMYPITLTPQPWLWCAADTPSPPTPSLFLCTAANNFLQTAVLTSSSWAPESWSPSCCFPCLFPHPSLWKAPFPTDLMASGCRNSSCLALGTAGPEAELPPWLRVAPMNRCLGAAQGRHLAPTRPGVGRNGLPWGSQGSTWHSNLIWIMESMPVVSSLATSLSASSTETPRVTLPDSSWGLQGLHLKTAHCITNQHSQAHTPPLQTRFSGGCLSSVSLPKHRG